MIYDDEHKIFDIDSILNLICNKFYLVLILTSMEIAYYLGMQYHHVYASH